MGGDSVHYLHFHSDCPDSSSLLLSRNDQEVLCISSARSLHDWTLVKEEGLRFENMVAVHLLKWVCWQQDVLGKDIELRYFRDIDKREVDFVVVEDGNPLFCVECKLKDDSISKPMLYFLSKFPECKGWQISLAGTKNVTTKEGIRIAPAEVFLGELE
ncbi:MAG: DUF4143 domain-containing protein [bacterium]